MSSLERAGEEGSRSFAEYNGVRQGLWCGTGNDGVQGGSGVGVCAKDAAFFRAGVALDMPTGQSLGADQRNGNQAGHHRQRSAAALRMLKQGSGIGCHVIRSSVRWNQSQVCLFVPEVETDVMLYCNGFGFNVQEARIAAC